MVTKPKRTGIFDTETTGLLLPELSPLSSQPSIIEFAGVVVDENDEIIEEIEFLCNPGFKVSEEITRITGIRNDQIVDQPSFEHNEKRVRDFIGSCDAIVAHNLKFDYGMVNNELKRCGTNEDIVWPEKICTVEKTMIIKGHRLSLSKLHAHLFGTPFDGAHRAMVDVKALTRCFIELRNKGYI